MLVALPAPAAAATPCWKVVINDWLNDGRIDSVYDDHCYAEAQDHLPTDLEEYSSLGDDINAARELALRRGGGEPGDGNGNGNGNGEGNGASPGSGSASGSSGGSGRERGIVREALARIGPSDAEEVPIPLVVLGAIATVLLAAGAAGLVARRTQHRRVHPGHGF